jgi:nitrogen regulatory protein P-II 1
MKRIEAVIRPEKILAVKGALESMGYGGMTVTEVKGYGTQRGVIEKWQGQELDVVRVRTRERGAEALTGGVPVLPE